MSVETTTKEVTLSQSERGKVSFTLGSTLIHGLQNTPPWLVELHRRATTNPKSGLKRKPTGIECQIGVYNYRFDIVNIRHPNVGPDTQTSTLMIGAVKTDKRTNLPVNSAVVKSLYIPNPNNELVDPSKFTYLDGELALYGPGGKPLSRNSSEAAVATQTAFKAITDNAWYLLSDIDGRFNP